MDHTIYIMRINAKVMVSYYQEWKQTEDCQ